MESLKKHLEELCDNVAIHIEAMDREMAKPSTEQRGRNIAQLMNGLNMCLDQALHFGLGLSFKKIKNRKAKLVRKYFSPDKSLGLEKP